MKKMKELRRRLGLFTKVVLCFVGLIGAGSTLAQKRINLDDAVKIATDSSLAAFKAQNLYLVNYWDYRSYSAQRKPSLTLNTTLLDYNRALIKRYNSVTDIDEYREQQNISSYANASIDQNIPLTGGKFYFDTELSRLQNFGDNDYTQFSAVPLRIGFVQPLFGFNKFKWQKKIEPLKFEKAKLTYVQTVEAISLQMVDYYFDLLIARTKVAMDSTNVANADTLYNIGRKRLEIASLSQADVLTLKVDALNAKNSLSEAHKELKNALYLFNSYLRIDERSFTILEVPTNLQEFQVNFDEAYNIALANNPDLLESKQQLLESERDFDQAKREGLWSASLTGSYGFNQQNSSLPKAYQDPLNQQRATVGITVPIIDWGQRKGKANMARKNYEIMQLTLEQSQVDFKQKLMMAVNNFNMQQAIVSSALETKTVAAQAYDFTKQRFLISKADVNSLSLALNRQDAANINYMEALRLYWKYYYTLRQLTLYDFKGNISLVRNFDNLFGL